LGIKNKVQILNGQMKGSFVEKKLFFSYVLVATKLHQTKEKKKIKKNAGFLATMLRQST